MGEPVTGRVNIPDGTTVSSLLMGSPDDFLLMASDAGYGFLAKRSDLYTKNKNGKAMLNLPSGALPLSPFLVDNINSTMLASITNEGRMLLFPLKDLPVLGKGKGNKIINIPSARAKSREEIVTKLFLLPEESHLILYSGKRHFTLKGVNLEGFIGTRGRRGKKLPRGYQNVDHFERKSIRRAQPALRKHHHIPYPSGGLCPPIRPDHYIFIQSQLTGRKYLNNPVIHPAFK